MNLPSLRLMTRCDEETRRVGEIIGRDLVPGDLLALTGDLGAGKTCLVQGIARGLAVPEESYVRSPTFVLLNIYEGRYPVYHMDLYRIQDPGELEDLGYRDYFYGEGVTVIEWAEKARHLLPPDPLRIHLDLRGEMLRGIALDARGGDRYRERWPGWIASLSRFLPEEP